MSQLQKPTVELKPANQSKDVVCLVPVMNGAKKEKMEDTYRSCKQAYLQHWYVNQLPGRASKTQHATQPFSSYTAGPEDTKTMKLAHHAYGRAHRASLERA